MSMMHTNEFHVRCGYGQDTADVLFHVRRPTRGTGLDYMGFGSFTAQAPPMSRVHCLHTAGVPSSRDLSATVFPTIRNLVQFKAAPAYSNRLALLSSIVCIFSGTASTARVQKLTVSTTHYWSHDRVAIPLCPERRGSEAPLILRA